MDLIEHTPKHYEVQEEYEARLRRYSHTSKDTEVLSKKTEVPSSHHCDHSGPMIVDHVQGGYVGQCSMCEMWGPISETPKQARQSLMNLGTCSSAANESEGTETKESVT